MVHPPRWLFKAGFVAFFPICLILTPVPPDDTTSKQQDDVLIDDGYKHSVLRDYWNVGKLFRMITRSCGFLNGERNSNQTLNAVWNISKTTPIEKLIEIDFYGLKRDLENLFKTIDSYPYDPFDDFNMKDGVDAMVQLRVLQNTSDQLKSQKLQKNIPDEMAELMDYAWEEMHHAATRLLDVLSIPKKFDTKLEINTFWETDHFAHLRVVYEVLQLANSASFKTIQAVLNDNSDIGRLTEVSIDNVKRHFDQLKEEYDNFQSLMAKMKKFIPIRDNLIWLKDLTGNIRKNPQIHRELSKSLNVYDDNIGFLKNVLNNNAGWEQVTIALAPIRVYIEDLIELDGMFHLLKNNTLGIIDQISESFDRHKDVQLVISSLKRTMSLDQCFKGIHVNDKTIYPNFTEIKIMLTEWKGFTDSLRDKFKSFFDQSDIGKYFGLARDEYKKLPSDSPDAFFNAHTELTKTPNFKKALDEVSKMIEFSALMIQNRIVLTEKQKEAWKRLNEFQNWLSSTNFGSFESICTESNFKYEAVGTFKEFHKSIGLLQDKEDVGSLVKEVLVPLRHGQVKIDKIGKHAKRMSRHPSSMHRNCRGLCNIMNHVKTEIADFEDGVWNLEMLFGTLEHRETVKKLLSVANFVIEYSNKQSDIERNSEPYFIGDWFEYMQGNESAIWRTFDDIEALDVIHKTGDWTSFKSLTVLFEKASEIRSPFLWSVMHDQMDRLHERNYKKEVILRKAINNTEKMSEMVQELSPRQLAFQKAAKSLHEIEMRFQQFYIWSLPKPVYDRLLKSELIHILFYVLNFFSVITIIYIFVRCPKRKRLLIPEDRIDDPDFIPCEENFHIWPLLVQASRLPMNKRDENDYTPLFKAVLDGQYDEAKRLVEAGAAIDAACGPDSDTALHVAARNGNRRMVDLLLMNGADPSARNIHGMSCRKVCSKENFCKASFCEYIDRKGKTIVPRVKRDFYVLIVDRAYFAEENLAMLPNSIEVVWGYKPSEVNLEDFTHIVVSPYWEGTKSFLVSIGCLFSFELAANPGMIVSVEWLNACLDDIANVDRDWCYLLTDAKFNMKIHPNSIIYMKNDIHKMKRPLFHGCEMTIVATRKPYFRKNIRMHYIHLIELLGGKYVEDPYPSDPERLPIHLPRNAKKKIYTSMVFFLPDGVLKERWLFPENHISVMPMGWWPNTVARYAFIQPDHESLKHELGTKKMPVIYEQGPQRWF